MLSLTATAIHYRFWLKPGFVAAIFTTSSSPKPLYPSMSPFVIAILIASAVAARPNRCRADRRWFSTVRREILSCDVSLSPTGCSPCKYLMLMSRKRSAIVPTNKSHHSAQTIENRNSNQWDPWLLLWGAVDLLTAKAYRPLQPRAGQSPGFVNRGRHFPVVYAQLDTTRLFVLKTCSSKMLISF